MGLHSKVRCEITLKGKTRVAQADEIVRFTEELYRFKVFYSVYDISILVESVFDTRQNPSKLPY